MSSSEMFGSMESVSVLNDDNDDDDDEDEERGGQGGGGGGGGRKGMRRKKKKGKNITELCFNCRTIFFIVSMNHYLL
jgi:hypothetical protein